MVNPGDQIAAGHVDPEGALPAGIKYRAFLSYRARDRRLAAWLHRKLEAYRVPRALVGSKGERGIIPRRLGRIFRDRDDARTAADIETVIADEISRSLDLIVLCTPAAAASKSWVHREIELFREHRADGQLHAVIGDGEPPDCFPAALLRTAADGRIETPIAADLRPRRAGGQDGSRRAVVKVVAGLIGVPFDALWRREERRRRLRLVMAASASLAIFVAGIVMYALLSASRFIREEASTLVVYAGHPFYNVPGLPRRLFSLEQSPESLQLPAAAEPTRAIAAVGPQGDIAAAVEALMRPDYRAATLANSGDNAAARSAALPVLGDASAPFEQHLTAWLVLTDVATADDVDRFIPLLVHERSELRLAAMRILFRFAPTRAEEAMRGMRPEHFARAQPDLLHVLQGPCSAAHRSFLQAAFQSPSNVPTNDDILDAAIRVGCTLSVSSLATGANRPTVDGQPSVAFFARYIGVERELANALERQLAGPDLDDWRRGGLVGLLVTLGHGTCTPSLRRGLTSRIAFTQLTTMVAVSRYCNDSTFEVSWNQAAQRFDTALLIRGRVEVSLAVPLNTAGNQLLVRQLQVLTGATATTLPGLRAVLEITDDDNIRAWTIRALMRANDVRPLPPSLTDSNNLVVRRVAIEHRRAQADREVVTLLIQRLGRDEFYETQLGRIPLQDRELAEVRALLHSAAPLRSQAACVMAMQGPPDAVLALLDDSEAEVRGRAADCLPFNNQAEAIAARASRTFHGFPVVRYATLHKQVELKLALQQQLRQMPAELRVWRLSIADATPAGWGLWGRGMRAWLQEQRFQTLIEHRIVETRQ